MGQHRLCLSLVQRAQGEPHAARGRDAATMGAQDPSRQLCGRLWRGAGRVAGLSADRVTLPQGLVRRTISLAIHVGVAVMQLGHVFRRDLLWLAKLQREPDRPCDVFHHHCGFDGGLGSGADGKDAVLFEKHGW